RQFAELLGQALERSGRKVPLKQGRNGLIPKIAKSDPEMQDFVEDDDPVVAALAGARLARGTAAQLVSRLETLRRIATATRGYLPVNLVFHGAFTGRFSGGGGFNIQNLPKGPFGKR